MIEKNFDYVVSIIDNHYIKLHGYFIDVKFISDEDSTEIRDLIVDVSDIKGISYTPDNYKEDCNANNIISDCYAIVILYDHCLLFRTFCTSEDEFNLIMKAYLEANSNLKKMAQDEAFKLLMANKLLNKNL